MKPSLVVLLVCLVMLSSCISKEGPALTPPQEPVGAQAPQLLAARGRYFSASGNCALCHMGMVDESGQDVSTDRLWRATMMANAARDPYWQASVRAETLENPDHAELIENKCATCHVPMAYFTMNVEGQDARLLDEGLLDPNHALHPLAMDGVSCNLCHQIQAEGLGDPDGFSGGFRIDTEKKVGERQVFGPYVIPEQQKVIMQGVSGYIPNHAAHIEDAELCGTCHTLYTPTLNQAGDVVGEFPEQMIYPEWQHSAYAPEQSCQACHMPLATGAVSISNTGSPPRSPFYQHYFVGGNTYMAAVFEKFGDDLNVTASPAQFRTTSDHAGQQLQNRTANLSLPQAYVQGDQLIAVVQIESLVGHKFPAGFPSRRAWLHFSVLDAQANPVFESGAYGLDGSIRGNANDDSAGQYEPHYTLISQPDQVQIYEAILHDVEGNPTLTLLYGAGYLKDNRLLPAGFDKAGAGPDIAVYGAAQKDEDFKPAGDWIEFRAPLKGANGPYEVTVELLYQTISYRWAHKLDGYDAGEAVRFLDYYQQVENLPQVIDRVSLAIEK